MRGSKAKKIRKAVYGDLSSKILRSYIEDRGIKNVGIRATYQQVKKHIEEGEHEKAFALVYINIGPTSAKLLPIPHGRRHPVSE